MIVWKTDHFRSQVMADAAYHGLLSKGIDCELKDVRDYTPATSPRPSISYGILRGSSDIYRACESSRIDWWNIDRGFFLASHFDGYYRVGYRHLQPIFVKESSVSKDDSRFRSFGIKAAPDYRTGGTHILLCPPTKAMCWFYGLDVSGWVRNMLDRIPWKFRKRIRIREKACTRPLKEDLAGARAVVVFNSNVAIEALLQGIPAVSTMGLVATWNPLAPEDLETDRMYQGDRKKLFNFAAHTQFTVPEIASGYAWETLKGIYGWKEGG